MYTADDEGEEAAVKVAVRVRPFNGREKAMNAGRAIDMDYKDTLVYEEDVDETELEPRKFAFDYSSKCAFAEGCSCDVVSFSPSAHPHVSRRLLCNVTYDCSVVAL